MATRNSDIYHDIRVSSQVCLCTSTIKTLNRRVYKRPSLKCSRHNRVTINWISSSCSTCYHQVKRKAKLIVISEIFPLSLTFLQIQCHNQCLKQTFRLQQNLEIKKYLLISLRSVIKGEIPVYNKLKATTCQKTLVFDKTQLCHTYGTLENR